MHLLSCRGSYFMGCVSGSTWCVPSGSVPNRSQSSRLMVCGIPFRGLNITNINQQQILCSIICCVDVSHFTPLIYCAFTSPQAKGPTLHQNPIILAEKRQSSLRLDYSYPDIHLIEPASSIILIQINNPAWSQWRRSRTPVEFSKISLGVFAL